MAGATEHAARRDTRITFEQLKDVSIDDAGHVDETQDRNWSSFASRWAEVYTRGSKEFFRAEQVVSDITHFIKVRWDKMLWRRLSARGATKLRVKIGNGIRRLNLSGPPVNEDEQDNYISFPCVEVR